MAISRGWSSNANDADIGILNRFVGTSGSSNSTIIKFLFYNLINVFFKYGCFAGIDQFCFKSIYIHPYNLMTIFCQATYTYTANITQSENRNMHGILIYFILIL